jgi:hypothetical protein
MVRFRPRLAAFLNLRVVPFEFCGWPLFGHQPGRRITATAVRAAKPTGDTRHDPHSCWCLTLVSSVYRPYCRGHVRRTEMAGKVIVPAAAHVRGVAELTASDPWQDALAGGRALP